MEIKNVYDNLVNAIDRKPKPFIDKYPCFVQLRGEWHWARSHYMDYWNKIKDGQPIEIEKTDKGCIVTKIN